MIPPNHVRFVSDNDDVPRHAEPRAARPWGAEDGLHDGTRRVALAGQAYQLADCSTMREQSARIGFPAVALGAEWTCRISVADGDPCVCLELHRGASEGHRLLQTDIGFDVPVGEVDALVALLVGTVAEARRSGVLPAG